MHSSVLAAASALRTFTASLRVSHAAAGDLDYIGVAVWLLIRGESFRHGGKNRSRGGADKGNRQHGGARALPTRTARRMTMREL